MTTDHAARLNALRAALRAAALDGFLISLFDAHLSEGIPENAKRLAWLTGFTGSAGFCVVLEAEAALFVDGRYTIQARQQVDAALFSFCAVPEEPPQLWLKKKAWEGAKIGFDPWMHSIADVEKFRQALSERGARLVAVEKNPIDELWTDRPPPPTGKFLLYDEALAGESRADKLARISRAIAEAGAGAAVLTQPDSIAWLFNIRGTDLPHTPVALAFALIPVVGRPTLFVAAEKHDAQAHRVLEGVAEIAPVDTFPAALTALGKQGARVLLDKGETCEKIGTLIREAGGTLLFGPDPVALPRARKNPAELAATRAAHVRDGVAMVRFLAWFDQRAHTGMLDEMKAAEALTHFRAASGRLKDLSFDTISAVGPNAALPHYRASPASNRPIREGDIYLIDSGGQYEDGTTDITRTLLAGGTASAEMRDRFTRVLKGHSAIARARFPHRTTGVQLDTLARLALWDAGLDFNHGTGHGVGVYLSVHEGPQRLSKTCTVPLEEGMILSNEPGYYKEGAFGIRIENLIVVTQAPPIPGGEVPMLSFETISLAPIDRRLIDKELLTSEERAWLDAYHARVHATLSPLLEEADTQMWLAAATAPL